MYKLYKMNVESMVRPPEWINDILKKMGLQIALRIFDEFAHNLK